jgi:hypothetical protein
MRWLGCQCTPRKVRTAMKYLFSNKRSGCVGLGVLVAGFMAFTATASANLPQCGTPEFSQPFLYAGDENHYTALPGESYDAFTGEGWKLTGGAQVVSTTLSDGSTGRVLDLPSGSKAVSPVICVTKYYPTARAIVRNVKGSEGVFFYVEYEGTNTWNHAKNTGQIHGQHTEWTLVTPVNMQPENNETWQPMRITLVPGGTTSDFEVYNLYVDPRMH